MNSKRVRPHLSLSLFPICRKNILVIFSECGEPRGKPTPNVWVLLLLLKGVKLEILNVVSSIVLVKLLQKFCLLRPLACLDYDTMSLFQRNKAVEGIMAVETEDIKIWPQIFRADVEVEGFDVRTLLLHSAQLGILKGTNLLPVKNKTKNKQPHPLATVLSLAT